MSTQVIPQNRVAKVEQSITVLDCCSCGVTFGIGKKYEAFRREDHGWFYCPNGHPQHFSGDNTEEKLRKDAERARKREQDAFDYATRERERRLLAERQRAAAKGQVTKLKNRIANGVCPCCNRSFANLRRHIEGQHPDFTLPKGVTIP